MESLRSKIQSIFSKANVDIKDCLDEENIEIAFELGYLMSKLETDVLDVLEEAEKNDR
jgi:hypothetical protein